MFSAIFCSCFFSLAALPGETSPPVVAGIPILITHGDTIAKIGDAPQEVLAVIPNVAIGYKYSYFGIFWLDFWTWGGEYCLFEGLKFDSLTPEQCAQLLKTNVNSLPKPWVYRIPLGLAIVLGLVAILVPLGMVASAKEKKEQARIQALFEDSRYKEAFEIFNKNLPDVEEPKAETAEGEAVAATPEFTPEQRQQQVEDGIKAAVDHLVHNGEDREVAEANFNTMLAIVMQMNAK